MIGSINKILIPIMQDLKTMVNQSNSVLIRIESNYNNYFQMKIFSIQHNFMSTVPFLAFSANGKCTKYLIHIPLNGGTKLNLLIFYHNLHISNTNCASLCIFIRTNVLCSYKSM